MEDVYNLFKDFPKEKKIQLIKDLDVMTDNLISDKMFSDDSSIEYHVEILNEFSKQLEVVSTYTDPNIYNDIDQP